MQANQFMLNRNHLFVALAAAGTLLLGGEARAANYQTTQAGSWADPTIWTVDGNPATTPPTSSDAVTSTSGTLTVANGTTTESVNGITQRSGMVVEAGGVLNSNGNHAFSSSASLDLYGTYNLTSGRFDPIPDRVSGAELEVFAGATLNAAGASVRMQHGQIGVYGSGSTFITKALNWEGHSTAGGGSLIFEADASGFSTVVVAEDNGAAGNLAFDFGNEDDDTLSVDVSALSPTGGEMWTLMTFDNIIRDTNGDDWEIKNILGAAEPSNWSLAVTDPGDTDPGTVTLHYVPEPASLALMGLGGSLMLVRRRRLG